MILDYITGKIDLGIRSKTDFVTDLLYEQSVKGLTTKIRIQIGPTGYTEYLAEKSVTGTSATQLISNSTKKVSFIALTHRTGGSNGFFISIDGGSTYPFKLTAVNSSAASYPLVLSFDLSTGGDNVLVQDIYIKRNASDANTSYAGYIAVIEG